ncbi:putative importin-beta domain-containing protein [Diaporthe ampelina]|uniref:Putative importin-beta domain-containing protein n=1 Tax=Diaporthe ampelina TaxID=1214573 RepID=A0A0G2I7J0_9PEZI|nr:putative importin-beta domain-containing protein [Diaporthe ampelina]
MEDQLAQLLANTQLPAEEPRKRAELDLKHAQTNPAFPVVLANIAAHNSVSTEIRQAALAYLRRFIEHNWSEEGDDGEGPLVLIPDSTKEELRHKLLDLALSEEPDRKVKASVSYAVGKIANNDFPEKWPSLLPSLLNVIANGNDIRLYGALKVLSDIVEESLTEDQFFSMARPIIDNVFNVAVNDGRKPTLRALAVHVFRGCFDLMDMVKDDHPKEVKGFAEESLKNWLPFFSQVLQVQLPESSEEAPQREYRNGIIAFKLQVVKTLMKVKSVFPTLLLPQSTAFFQAAWHELSLLQDSYKSNYIDNGSQGRLEDSDGLPYTLDFLILEELDFLNQCMRATPVQKELEAQLGAGPAHEIPWILDLMKLLVAYSRITHEEEELWDIDVSLYLAEETSEACLYLFNMLISDLQDRAEAVPPEVAQAHMELIDYAIGQDQPLLRARGFLVASTLAQIFPPVAGIVDKTIESVSRDSSELVQVACVKAVEGFVSSSNVPADRQVPMLVAINGFLDGKDMTDLMDADDLLVTLAEALRAVISIDPRVTIASDIKSIDLLFLIAKHGASNFQVTVLVCEAFEELVQSLSDSASYAALCAKVLPTITGAFNVADMTSDDPLLTLACELLVPLVQNGSEPLPAGFVAATLPKVKNMLLQSPEGEVLRPGAEAIKYMLMHDHHQVLGWHDENGQSGLETCLIIIDRLLGPNIEDNAASEVGGLAAELVEKAGPERLGPYLEKLLQAVANRLATAEAAPFIQSLIIVFARLSLMQAGDVVQFLSNIDIGGHNGLQVVLSKWLENSVNFAGYDEIRQNVIALSKLYSLNDARLAQTMVKGDLIMQPSDGRIMTRSRAKQNPDQYTLIPATLKILKVLIEELISASGVQGAANAAAAAAAEFADADEDDGDEGWEDEFDSVGLGSNAQTLMNLAEGANSRMRDDETQQYLSEFFVRAARENIADFQNWYGMLTEDEKSKLNELATAQ